MKKTLNVVVTVAAFVLGGIGTAVAQEEARAVPVEYFACNFNEGKDMDDLKKVNAKFVDWVKKNDPGYSAWVLTPQFHDGLGYDIGWLGSWNSAEDFGKGQDTWQSKGQDIAAQFWEVIDCASHGLASSVPINAPDGPPGDGIVMFAQCTVHDGKTLNDSHAAHEKLSAAMKDMGSLASSWLFYPTVGLGRIDFHYWQVIAFNNYTEFGKSAEIYTNGGGWDKAMQTLGPVTRCTSPTLFDAHLVRAGEQ